MKRSNLASSSLNGQRKYKTVHIGQKIKEMRQERGLSLTMLAAKAGIAKSYLSNIERQVQSNPSMLFLEKLSRVFDVEVESLVTDSSTSPEIDPEWAALVKEAVEVGVEKEEFRSYIDYKKFTNWSQEQD